MRLSLYSALERLKPLNCGPLYSRYLVDNFQTTFRIQDTFNVHFRHIQNAFQILSRLFYYILQAMSRHLLSTRSKTKFPKVYLRFVVFVSLRQVNRKTKIHTLPPPPLPWKQSFNHHHHHFIPISSASFRHY